MKLKYKDTFLKNASMLDAMSIGDGSIIEKAETITREQCPKTTIELLRQIKNISSQYQGDDRIIKATQVFKNSFVDYYGWHTIYKLCGLSEEHNEVPIEETNEKSLEDLLGELSQLIGLNSVKSKVNDLITFQCIQKLRKDYGLKTSQNTLHLAFTGNPGTGKTTVARIVGKIYKHIGLLSKGHFLEVSRTDLIAGYQGQTALKVKKVIERAKGGVLFIDEAYSLTENDHTDSYGRECLTELTKALEDYREDLVVIVAGYTEPMKIFFESNPGLMSRFNTFIEFNDYSVEELIEIMFLICKKNDYMLEEDAIRKIKRIFEERISIDGNRFANGRYVRNLFDDIVMNQARRLMKLGEKDIEELKRITADDVLLSDM